MTVRDQGRRERIFNIPAVVVAVCVVLLLIYGVGTVLSPERYGRLLVRFAFVPGRFTFAFDPDRVAAALNAAVGPNDIRWQVARIFLGDGTPQWWTLLTYAFLHASWAHVGFNCLWLVAFGGAVAKRFRSVRFLLLMGVAAVAGALVHYLFHMNDLEPVIGASAAVSGAMGAACRFVFQTRRSVAGPERTGERDADLRLPALSLRETFTRRGPLSFVVIWFVSNLLFGVSGAMPGLGGATIAWEAHIGGFLAGLLLFRMFDPVAPYDLKGEPPGLGPDSDPQVSGAQGEL